MTQFRGGFAGLTTAVVVLLCSTLSRGQTASPPSGTPTIHVISDLIEIPVLALKPPFRPAPALNRSEFVIRLDGGPPFHPSHTRIEGAEPLTLSVLVEADTRESSILSQGLQAALQNWAPNLLGGSDRLSLYVYGCQLVRSLHDEPVDLIHGRDELLRAISPRTFQAAMEGGKSCPQPSAGELLDTLIDQISKTTNWKVIILISNGEHKVDPKSLERVQAFAAAEGVTLFAIKYLHNGSFPASVYSETEGVNHLVASLGGITVHSSFDDLGEVTETIIEDIRQRYILSFPRPGNGSAGVHRLEITSAAKGVRVLPSAAAAPLVDSTRCTNGTDTWLCSQNRPQFGTENPEH